MRTCALALRVQVRHKYMLSTCEKPIVICVQLLMKQGGDCVMHVMAATVLSVVKARPQKVGTLAPRVQSSSDAEGDSTESHDY